MCVLQDNKKLNEKFIKIKENGKLCDANISSQQTAQNVITGALKMKWQKPLRSGPGCQTKQCREAIQDLEQ